MKTAKYVDGEITVNPPWSLKSRVLGKLKFLGNHETVLYNVEDWTWSVCKIKIKYSGVEHKSFEKTETETYKLSFSQL